MPTSDFSHDMKNVITIQAAVRGGRERALVKAMLGFKRAAGDAVVKVQAAVR